MKLCLSLMLFITSTQIFPDDLNQAYQEGSTFAQAHSRESIELLKTLDVSQFPGFEANRPEQNYYEGVTQESTRLEADSQDRYTKSDAGKAVDDSFHTRSDCKVDSESEDMQKLNQIAENGDDTIHGEDVFCLDGNCSSQEYEPAKDEDFKKGMSYLSAATDASKDFDGKANIIFKGEKLECSRLMAGAKNCCRESGWGIDMNLLHCTDEEKKLGKAKENKLVVATGEYCFNRKKWPGGSKCVEHHQTYCVFQSKLARIVQEQGRRDQLGIGFGEGKKSDCSGLTPKQMQLVAFGNIDFAEFYDDIKSRTKEPDYQKTAADISQRMKDYYNQGGKP